MRPEPTSYWTLPVSPPTSTDPQRPPASGVGDDHGAAGLVGDEHLPIGRVVGDAVGVATRRNPPDDGAGQLVECDELSRVGRGGVDPAKRGSDDDAVHARQAGDRAAHAPVLRRRRRARLPLRGARRTGDCALRRATGSRNASCRREAARRRRGGAATRPASSAERPSARRTSRRAPPRARRRGRPCA